MLKLEKSSSPKVIAAEKIDYETVNIFFSNGKEQKLSLDGKEQKLSLEEFIKTRHFITESMKHNQRMEVKNTVSIFSYKFRLPTSWSSLSGGGSQVFLPPGSTAVRLFKFLFSKKAFDSVFAEAINDMREEHAEALENRELHKARWIVVRDHFGLALTLVVYLSASFGKKLWGIWRMIP